MFDKRFFIYSQDFIKASILLVSITPAYLPERASFMAATVSSLGSEYIASILSILGFACIIFIFKLHAGRSSTVIPMAEAILYNVATVGTVSPLSILEIYPLSAPIRLASSACVSLAFLRASNRIWALYSSHAFSRFFSRSGVPSLILKPF